MVARLPDLLDFANLAHKADEPIGNLSGGMKRRLTLARALVNDPDLIFLDEPTTGLDPQARHLMWQGLRRLIAQGKTILLTTHFMEEAERLCDRLAILDHGRIITEGAPRALIEQHIEPQVVEIYGDNIEAWTRECGEAMCERLEHAGETVFCYTRQHEDVLRRLCAQNTLRYLSRPASLEDVFLKLTGRDLRD
jgi:lipooligosaccharide transport system ATP-binding protein